MRADQDDYNEKSAKKILAALHAPNRLDAERFLTFKKGQRAKTATRRHYASALETFDRHLNAYEAWTRLGARAHRRSGMP